MRIVVLGGSGLLGRQVARRLLFSQDLRPVTVSRHSAVTPDCPHAQVDITDTDELEKVIDGAAVVVDAAALPIRAMLPAITTLSRAAAQGRIGRIVHCGSLGVYGQREGTMAETVTPVPAKLHRYAHAKLACERALEPAPDAIVLRHACLISPTSPAWVERFVNLLAEKRLGDLGTAGSGIASLLPVATAANAIVAACTAITPERVVNLPGFDGWTWRRYILRLAAAMGLPRPPRMAAWQINTSMLVSPLRRVIGDTSAITPSLTRVWRQRLVFSHVRAAAFVARPTVAELEGITQDAGALFRRMQTVRELACLESGARSDCRQHRKLTAHQETGGYDPNRVGRTAVIPHLGITR